MPSYTGSGNVNIDGCGYYDYFLNLAYRFKVGDTCYLKYKAIKGKLEKIVIKEIKVVTNYDIKGIIKFMYIDTLNAIYGEEDLLLAAEAVSLAKQYYEFQIFLAAAAKTTCQLRPQGKNSYSGRIRLPGGLT